MRYLPFLTLSALAAAAAPAQDLTHSDVIIRAPTHVNRAEARSQVAGIAWQTNGQLGRFIDPVCPEVMGMPEPYASIVVKRIRFIAAQLGVPLDNAKCSPNLFVVLSDDPRAFIRSLEKKGGLRLLTDARRAELLNEGPPAIAWATGEMRNEDGERKQPHTIMQDQFGRALDIGTNLPTRTASITDVSSQIALTQSVIVFENAALVGKTLTQIADYAATRTLADTRASAPATAANVTILTLFDRTRTAPPELTSFDWEYLKALYRIRPTQGAIKQISEIGRAISKASGEK